MGPRRDDFSRQSANKHAWEVRGNETEDDLDVDLTKAAMETGTAAFEAGNWEEAESLLQEALHLLQQLPPDQRTFCDLFAMHYRLAVCSYHSQEPARSQNDLLSFLHQPATSPEHLQYTYSALHHLALVYVRMGWIDEARAECEKALQGRRRLLGKQSEAALQSTALIAHIYGLANNRARATACLAMILESRRGEIMSDMLATLSAHLKHTESLSLSSGSMSEKSMETGRSTGSDSQLPEYAKWSKDGSHGSVTSASSELSASPVAGVRPSIQRDYSGSESLHPLSVTRSAVAQSSLERSYSEPDHAATQLQSLSLRAEGTVFAKVSEPQIATTVPENTGLTRMDILRNLRCAPSDKAEEAVCNGDSALLMSVLSKKKSGTWRSKMHKALHSRRINALHFAALFGEIEMARALLSAGYDINEIPEQSATRQTPLKFAIGARQVEMVSFLTGRGARPIEPDSWATLAGLLMDRSWLSNTVSMADRQDLDQVPTRIQAILKMWMSKGWDIKTPYNAAGRTLLHQAVAFESGFYKWDAHLRGKMVRFLCSEGADPTCKDTKGNSPYDMATVVEDQDVLLVFDQRLKMKDLGRDLDQRLEGLVELDNTTTKFADYFELPADPRGPVELPGG